MRRLLSVTIFTGLLTFMKMCAGFIVSKVVAIYIGPSGLAMLGQIQNIVALFNGLVNSPAGAGVVRFTSQNYDNGDISKCVPWWRASMRWCIIVSSLVIISVIPFNKELSLWLFNDNSYSPVIIITVLILPLTALGTMINSVINGQQKYRVFVSIGMISVIISTAVMVILIMKFKVFGGLLAVSIQYGVIGFTSLLLCLRFAWVRPNYWFGKTSPDNMKHIFHYMLMAITSAFCLPLSLILIRKILIFYVGWDLTGQWQAVWKISEAYLSVVTLALSTYFLPKLSKLTTYGEIKREITSTVLVIMPLIVIMGIFIYIMRDKIIFLLFTNDFIASISLFKYQLCGDFIKILAWIFAYPLISQGKVKWYITLEILSAFLFVTLSFIFIQKLGLSGVFFAYIVNYLFYFLF
ncbi:O74 family O-antigen flippase, partial [Escherichia coli]|nr:O74 family O-antigen flippase [Escherichia coli]